MIYKKKVLPELVTSVWHQQLINCGFVWGVTHNKPFRLPSLSPLIWRCIRPLCIPVVMLQDLPGSTQDRLSLQAGMLFLFNVLHIFVSSRVCTPHASTHAHYLDAPCDPKNRNEKAYINKTLSALPTDHTYGIQQTCWTLKNSKQFTHFIYYKLAFIKLESLPDIWGHRLLCSEQHQATTFVLLF